jgi:hypothetical protein
MLDTQEALQVVPASAARRQWPTVCPVVEVACGTSTAKHCMSNVALFIGRRVLKHVMLPEARQTSGRPGYSALQSPQSLPEADEDVRPAVGRLRECPAAPPLSDDTFGIHV